MMNIVLVAALVAAPVAMRNTKGALKVALFAAWIIAAIALGAQFFAGV